HAHATSSSSESTTERLTGTHRKRRSGRTRRKISGRRQMARSIHRSISVQSQRPEPAETRRGGVRGKVMKNHRQSHGSRSVVSTPSSTPSIDSELWYVTDAFLSHACPKVANTCLRLRKIFFISRGPDFPSEVSSCPCDHSWSSSW